MPCPDFLSLPRLSPDLSRRTLLTGATLGALGWFGRGTALAGGLLDPMKRSGKALVVLFLRGGADGLSLVPPTGDGDYFRLRPNLALAAPGDRTASAARRALDAGGLFGLHPSLAPLLPLYREGDLRIVHAAGSMDRTRSHFEAMSTVERGAWTGREGDAGGWLARYLARTARPAESPLRAVAIGSTVPDSLRGGPLPAQFSTLDEYRLDPALVERLRTIYAVGEDEATEAGRRTLEALARVATIRPTTGASYPDTPLGHGLRDVAALLRADVGLEVATLDHGIWDTHVRQGVEDGWLAGHADEVARALAAFWSDLGPARPRTRVLVMSEFGRRAGENSGLGTDHGRAGAMFALGEGIGRGKVEADWPGLREQDLEGPGDLRVTTDYRRVVEETMG